MLGCFILVFEFYLLFGMLGGSVVMVLNSFLSALAALVSDGVCLLILSSPLFIYGFNILLLISRLTIFLAGSGTNFEYGLRKIFVQPTLRELGLIN